MKHIFQCILFFRTADELGKGGTLSGNKRLVYALLKILRKIHEEADSESSTSFKMKYTVENALREEIYETEPVSKSLQMVLQNWTTEDKKFEGVCLELRNIGISQIKIDFEKEGGGLMFIKRAQVSPLSIEEPKPISPSPFRKRFKLFVTVLTLITIGGLGLGGILAFQQYVPKSEIPKQNAFSEEKDGNNSLSLVEIFNTPSYYHHITTEISITSKTVTSDVMLITGGYDGSHRLSSVEIFEPDNLSLTCTLPDMTVARYYHAAVAMTVCGGDHYGDVSQSCETFDGKQWRVTYQLQQNRENHVMWQSLNKGMVIMGGWESSVDTIETLQDDGSSVMEQWKLKYDTRYGDITNTE